MIDSSVHFVVSAEIDEPCKLQNNIGDDSISSVQHLKLTDKRGHGLEIALFYGGDRPLLPPMKATVDELRYRTPTDTELLRALFEVSSPITLAHLLEDLESSWPNEARDEIARLARGNLIGVVGHADHRQMLEKEIA